MNIEEVRAHTPELVFALAAFEKEGICYDNVDQIK